MIIKLSNENSLNLHLKILQALFINFNYDTCQICLDSIKNLRKLVTNTCSCNIFYHKKCLEKAFQGTCLVCRQSCGIYNSYQIIWKNHSFEEINSIFKDLFKQSPNLVISIGLTDFYKKLLKGYKNKNLNLNLNLNLEEILSKVSFEIKNINYLELTNNNNNIFLLLKDSLLNKNKYQVFFNPYYNAKEINIKEIKEINIKNDQHSIPILDSDFTHQEIWQKDKKLYTSHLGAYYFQNGITIQRNKSINYLPDPPSFKFLIILRNNNNDIKLLQEKYISNNKIIEINLLNFHLNLQNDNK